ncbi:MAG: acylphosphatase [Candidatus Thermoplasmatota archaeon]|jgi:acylphosphatase|nr:acylphosphatase [Candidatus Thermoplasmatota archaeon]
MEARAHIIYEGKVQGVSFRANCRKNAIQMGLKGWVRNLPDGSVESVVEGDRVVIEHHIAWNRTEQPYSVVTSVDISWEGAKGMPSGFLVRG